MHGTWARHPWLDEPGRPEFAAVERRWGTGTLSFLADSMAQTTAGRRFFGRFERQAATPVAARRLVELMSAIDVTPLLGSIQAPTLVVHRSHDRAYGIDHARDLVAGIPHARLVRLPGTDHFLFSGATAPILAAVREFVIGASADPAPVDRFLATVLVADLTASGADAGPIRPGLMDEVAVAAGRLLKQSRGRLVAISDARLVATFDGPGRGVLAAGELRDALAPLGVAIRAGLHTGELEHRHHDIAGVAVTVANSLAAVAEPGSIWVSRTVTDLVAGWGLGFTPRGEHHLDGLSRPLAVFEVTA